MIETRRFSHTTLKLLQAKATHTALTGVMIAVAAVILATIISGYLQFDDISINSAIAVQQQNFVLWVLDIIPFAFAYWGQKMSSVVSKEADAIISDHQNRTKLIVQQATHSTRRDPLTGLSNRIEFADLLIKEITKTKLRTEKLALLTLSIDQFKEINSSLGHSAGDQVLKQIAERLLSVALFPMSVARTGGDEFSIIVPGIENEDSVHVLVNKLKATLNNQFNVEKFPIAVQVSMGATICPDQSDEAGILTLYADLAMRSAKICQSRFAFFEDNMAKPDTRQLQMVGELRNALQNNLMSLNFQPKVGAKTRQFTSVEVLARWLHIELGQVPPVEFISLAERSGLINQLTYWVIDESLRQCAQWWDEHGQVINIAVNLSVHTLIDPELCARTSAYLAKYNIPADRLSFEITETSIMSDTARSLQTLRALTDLGVGISIDDFGTGYSSLTYLKQLPASEIKIDQSFVNNILTDAGDAAIVRSTIRLAHNFGLKAVAEGVEHEAVAQQLEHWGCDILQGYHFSVPLPPDELITWLQQTQSMGHLDQFDGTESKLGLLGS